MATIKGKVLDANGAGKGGVRVWAREMNVGGAQRIDADAVTPDTGDYSIQIPDPAAATRYRLTTGVVPENVLKHRATGEVDVNPGDGDLAKDLVLAPLSIIGKVVLPNPLPAGLTRDQVRIGVRDQSAAAKATVSLSDADAYYVDTIEPGSYTVQVENDTGARLNLHLPAHNVAVTPNATTDGIDFDVDVVQDFLGRLDDTRFSLDSTINADEAEQAIRLFAVVTLMQAGLGRARVGSEDKLDVLGILRLYYGLQDGSLNGAFTFDNSTTVWKQLQGNTADPADLTDLGNLAKELGRIQSDIEVLNREAKRQFNLGTSNGVVSNVEFPRLFKRYVDIGSDPLLSLNLREQEANNFFDRERLQQAYDLLRDLKGVIIDIVRSLSKYGTVATQRVNEDWARLERNSMEMLATVAQYRKSSDQDDRNQWAVLADLTGKTRETEIAPYVVLARHGTKLLRIAIDVYNAASNRLEFFDHAHLADLFQEQHKEFRTTKIREQAMVVKRYPLSQWT